MPFIICGEVHTLPLAISISMSAFLAHLSQKLGSSREMSVRFPDATKLAWKQTFESYQTIILFAISCMLYHELLLV